MKEIVMKTFYGDDGNYAEIPLSKILEKMTDDWIDDEVTGANISELRDACRKLLEIAHKKDIVNTNEKLVKDLKMKNAKKIILHLCADIGSDSLPYKDAGYDVRCIGSNIGIENYNPTDKIYGIIANPPCTEFSTARSDGKARNNIIGLYLVEHCKRIIKKANPKFWVIENPARGILKKYLGKPEYKYEPWWYGSPWTKQTALWGNFNIPKRIYYDWQDVPKNERLYIRPKREKPSLAFLHKSAIDLIPEFFCFKDKIKDDAGFRSLCSQNFAKAFFDANQ